MASGGMRRMTTVVMDRFALSIPAWVQDLESFRRWAGSADVPEKAPISWINDEVWVDLSREQLFTHNQVRCQFDGLLGGAVKAEQLGYYVTAGMFLANAAGDFCCRPDAVFISFESLRSGRLRLVKERGGDYGELEGSPDMVLEVVSTPSAERDTAVLRDLYWKAGVREYWLVDARGEKPLFDILRHAARGYVATKKRAGWLKSAVFDRSFQLLRDQDRRGHSKFTLAVLP